jgi:hypothetical protein
MARPILRGLLFLFLLIWVVACGDGGLTDLATETCEDLEDSIVLTAGSIVERAIEDAEEMGFTGPELGDKMREVCPEIMAALEGIGEEQEQRENLPNEMDLQLDECNSDGATGTVTNNSDVTADVFIDVQFTSEDGTLIDTGFASVNGLRPGQTGEWQASFFGDGLDRCAADISSASES